MSRPKVQTLRYFNEELLEAIVLSFLGQDRLSEGQKIALKNAATFPMATLQYVDVDVANEAYDEGYSDGKDSENNSSYEQGLEDGREQFMDDARCTILNGVIEIDGFVAGYVNTKADIDTQNTLKSLLGVQTCIPFNMMKAWEHEFINQGRKEALADPISAYHEVLRNE